MFLISYCKSFCYPGTGKYFISLLREKCYAFTVNKLSLKQEGSVRKYGKKCIFSDVIFSKYIRERIICKVESACDISYSKCPIG